MEECRRLAYARLGPAFEDANGELLPVNEWPKEDRQTALQLLSLKQQGLMGVLKYLKHAGVYGQPEPPSGNSLTLNPVTVVPVERLTDEELDFYLRLAEKGRAIPIDATATAAQGRRDDAVKPPVDEVPRTTR